MKTFEGSYIYYKIDPVAQQKTLKRYSTNLSSEDETVLPVVFRHMDKYKDKLKINYGLSVNLT